MYLIKDKHVRTPVVSSRPVLWDVVDGESSFEQVQGLFCGHVSKYAAAVMAQARDNSVPRLRIVTVYILYGFHIDFNTRSYSTTQPPGVSPSRALIG